MTEIARNEPKPERAWIIAPVDRSLVVLSLTGKNDDVQYGTINLSLARYLKAIYVKTFFNDFRDIKITNPELAQLLDKFIEVLDTYECNELRAHATNDSVTYFMNVIGATTDNNDLFLTTTKKYPLRIATKEQLQEAAKQISHWKPREKSM